MLDAARILIADDQPDVLMALKLLLKGEGWETEAVGDPDSAYRAAAARMPSLVLIDLNYTRDTTSGQEGLDLLERLGGLPAPPPVVVMTAWGSIELAVEAMRRGARDFVPKPWDNARLVETVRKHLAPSAARRDGIARDLEIARGVQRQLLPQRRPALASLAMDAHCRPAGLVGGDFYDYLDLGPGRAGLVLADISGKGMAAALLMANLQAAIRSLAPQISGSLPGMLRALNQQFRESTAPEHYATLLLGEYDDGSRVLRYVNCGHPAGLVIRGGEVAATLATTAPVIGILPDLDVEVGEIALERGDLVVLYSDGASEPFAAEDGLGGEDRLIELIRESPGRGAEELAGQLASFQDEQADDITVMLARAV
ncbi:MAG: SpoIIE family protein phosphatase [Bryobacteraceae bacterium]|nr:SpoIIE family protein phosphatase [Solibacteraceae bacterium]MCO5349839.1 SpoIIE family protein phosphatase [Bryobacteraceae bacterium]